MKFSINIHTRNMLEKKKVECSAKIKCLQMDSNQFPRYFTSMLYLLSYQGIYTISHKL